MRVVSTAVAIAITCVLGSGIVAQPRADMVDDCVQDDDMTLKKRGCLKAVDSGRWSGAELAWAYSNLGSAYRSLGDVDAAFESFSSALALDPEHRNAYNNRAAAYEDLGMHSRALRDVEKALLIDPDYANGYNTRANIRCAMGRVEGSIRDRMNALRGGRLTAAGLQGYFKDRGYYRGPIDGDFGPKSRKALESWTRDGCK